MAYTYNKQVIADLIAKGNKAEAMEAVAEALRERLQRALNRGEKHVSNIFINKVTAQYKSMGITKYGDIMDDLETIKGAKSLEELIYNIAKGLRAGTRTDGQKVDFSNFDLF